MPWWVRMLVTLVLTPFLWLAGTLYGQSVLGSAWPDLLHDAPSTLVSVFVAFTIPAFVVCAILLGVDMLLKRAGLTLLTIVVSPLIALGLALLVLQFVHPEQAGSTAEAAGLFALYGAVWGLTIREAHARSRRGAPIGAA